MLQNEDEGDGFFVCLCRDVLLEALLFGNRRRLIILEGVGRRFHQIIDNFIKEKPFLRLWAAIDWLDFFVFQ